MSNSDLYKQWISNNKDRIVDGLVDLLKINTVFDPTTVSDEAPYGQGIAEGLAYMKDLADKEGFETFVDNGQYLIIELVTKEPTDKRVDVVGHMDVVAVGDGWIFDPFGAEIIDNLLYARGSQDMKSAVWLSYMSLVMIKELDIQLTHNLRLVIGTDEESSFKDIEYYVEQNGLPEFMFTPDSSFQITLGEKGDAAFSIEGNLESDFVESIETFNSENMINDRVDVIIKDSQIQAVKDALVNQSFNFLLEHNKLTIIGKAAHSSRPELGENALAYLFKFLAESLNDEVFSKFNKSLYDYNGSGLGFEPFYEPMGTVTVNPSQCHYDGDEIKLVVDIRFPNPITRDDLLKALTEVFSTFDIGNHFHFPPTEVSLDNPYVEQLTHVYDEWIGENQPAFYSGGITYAKLFQGVGVAFGISYLNDGMESLAHQANEYFNLDSIPTTLGALTDSMIRLCQL
ncbi:Sapep family Mn(2+)-dependent dipeptidase [Aerococcaceae bacterium WGS1372]